MAKYIWPLNKQGIKKEPEEMDEMEYAAHQKYLSGSLQKNKKQTATTSQPSRPKTGLENLIDIFVQKSPLQKKNFGRK